MKKGIIITSLVIVVIVSSIWAFMYTKPGVYAKYKCNEGGDNKRKFYGENWKARGAVCSGMYIPIGAKLNGAETTKTLEWMSELVTNNTFVLPTDKAGMKTLAEAAAIEANKV